MGVNNFDLNSLYPKITCRFWKLKSGNSVELYFVDDIFSHAFDCSSGNRIDFSDYTQERYEKFVVDISTYFKLKADDENEKQSV